MLNLIYSIRLSQELEKRKRIFEIEKFKNRLWTQFSEEPQVGDSEEAVLEADSPETISETVMSEICPKTVVSEIVPKTLVPEMVQKTLGPKTVSLPQTVKIPNVKSGIFQKRKKVIDNPLRRSETQQFPCSSKPSKSPRNVCRRCSLNKL